MRSPCRDLGMEDSGYYSRGRRDFEMCSSSDSAHSIFNLKYSDLPTSKYNYLLYGFKDENDFEEFKQDLRDFQKLKNECSSDAADGYDGSDDLIDLNELQFICRPNYVCKNRRGRASRCAREFKQNLIMPPKTALRPSSKSSFPSCVNSADQPTYLEDKTVTKDNSDHTSRSLRAERPDSIGRRTDSEKRSSIYGFNRNGGLESNISDDLTEFLNEDEHFQEFERVLETVRNRRFSKDLDTSCRLSSDRDSRCYMKLDNENSDRNSKDIRQSSARFVSDVFEDFFDNDETFMEFEKEFEKFRSNRRSGILDSLNNVGLNRDSFIDLKACCDRNMKSSSESLVNTSSFSTQVEAVPSCECEIGNRRSLIRRSSEDWMKTFRNMKWNSCLLLDVGHSECLCQHRHSVIGLLNSGKETGGQHSGHSLGDLSRSQRHSMTYGLSREAANNMKTTAVHSVAGLKQQLSLHGFESKQKSEMDFTRGHSSFMNTNDNDNDGKWPETLSCDNLDPPGCMQCWSRPCFCYSDLHIEETCDELLTKCDTPGPARARSHSLMEFKNQPQCTDIGMHTNSLDNLRCSIGFRECDTTLTDSFLRMVSHRKNDTRQSSDLHIDEDFADTNTIWSRPSSAASSQFSDADSEHYHTATSDLSDQYSTAESDLSVFIDECESGVIGRCVSLDLPAESNAAVGLCDGMFDWSKRQVNENGNRKHVMRRQRHSYHGTDSRDKYKYDRPRCGLACQYTCHEHCVSAVTLSCKSISGDGCDAIGARTASPSAPRSLVETSLLMGNIHARPGRIVPNIGNSTTDTTTVGVPRVSESVPNFQYIAQEKRRGLGNINPELSYVHTDTPRPFNLSTHHRSWSISEDFATAHSYPIHHPGIVSGPAPDSSYVQLTSSPQCLPSYSDRQVGSRQYKDSSRQPEPHSVSLRPESDTVGGVIESTSVTQHVSVDNSAVEFPKDNSHLHFPDVHRPDEETNPEATTEKDETDSGYRSGTIPDDKLPRVPSQATLDQQELQRKVAKYNHFVPAACLEVTVKESFQGFMKVTMNLIRPITMELGARPPSIYELLTREHIIEENTQQVAFYMPRDTHKSLHITSDTTTKEVITSLLKKFHILDHPRKFAMYEQEFSDRNKLVRLRRLTDKDYPLRAMVNWDPERMKNYRMVLQENETGEIVWDAFSLPELNNFLRVLDREEKETILDLKHKYAYMKQYIDRRLIELRSECSKKSKNKT